MGQEFKKGFKKTYLEKLKFSENIYNKFKAFIGEKDNFIDEVDGLYKDALEKYRVN